MKKTRSFEWWMVSNIAAGAATASFITLLIPPFITEVTGSAARAGIVLALIGLAALVGPQIGRFADRTKKHQLLYALSIAGLAGGFALLVLDAAAEIYSPLIGLVLGISLAAQGTIGPAFIVGAGQEPGTVAKQLTVYSLLFPVGQVIGAVVIGIGQLLDFSFKGLFWLAASTLLAFAIITWGNSKRPSQRLAQAQQSRPTESSGQAVRAPRKAIIFSTFGLFLLAATLGAIANNGMTSQVANILPTVYGFSATQTSGVIALAGFLSIGILLFGGWLMRRRGGFSVYALGGQARFWGMLGMTLIGALSGSHLVLASLFTLIAFQGPQLTRMVAPNMASELAPVQAAEANGFYFATSALGAFIGSLAAGFIADTISFSAINWMNTILAGLAIGIIVVLLKPQMQRFPQLLHRHLRNKEESHA